MRPSERLDQNRTAIRAIVAAHRARNPRVFGSVLRREDTENSDLDLLVDPEPGMTLFDIGAMRWKLRDLLQVPVDVVSPDALPAGMRADILATAKPV
ncbi:nucleotidyltransferase family protein [Rhodopila sp.]|jgi:predicted nucleotidyltransferase|uniref:nucleotidyltransferase family protein n=1 Tax=Rhodopila sp. TaxID=2480087 RepID=UPI002BFD6BFF|nr:nucleotidyltransferase family protein [Rhodopila sp.]HVZ10306.1 nucleotidyltransferase family protein [Rhodopila sp.]